MDWGRWGAWRLFWDAFHASLGPGLVGQANAVAGHVARLCARVGWAAGTREGFVHV